LFRGRNEISALMLSRFWINMNQPEILKEIDKSPFIITFLPIRSKQLLDN
jgi:hypothetical protein